MPRSALLASSTNLHIDCEAADAGAERPRCVPIRRRTKGLMELHSKCTIRSSSAGASSPAIYASSTPAYRQQYQLNKNADNPADSGRVSPDGQQAEYPRQSASYEDPYNNALHAPYLSPEVIALRNEVADLRAELEDKELEIESYGRILLKKDERIGALEEETADLAAQLKKETKLRKYAEKINRRQLGELDIFLSSTIQQTEFDAARNAHASPQLEPSESTDSQTREVEGEEQEHIPPDRLLQGEVTHIPPSMVGRDTSTPIKELDCKPRPASHVMFKDDGGGVFRVMGYTPRQSQDSSTTYHSIRQTHP
eukprot:NODE_2828_length_1332_cov_49.315136_g2687_i0.p1 GENE.NODE_2828_length_1332_cov_49.315136_g2687_i0~~NODE_2828_length_1332_cov_49.315136_g2687_i0.p1  ORF type:complete len:311 (+),score=47.75 NODE_2828_length_1332_cov_49.315136_g2687_i0:63-995(+)